jgi:hypothetical protein
MEVSATQPTLTSVMSSMPYSLRIAFTFSIPAPPPYVRDLHLDGF